MKTRIRSHFWIEDLNELVKEKVSTCETCQRFTQKTTKEPVAAQKTTDTGWEEVSIDLFGPLPNKKHVLVMQDTMSRFPAATIVNSTAAKPIIKAVDDVYTSYGQPLRHRTDNGPPFASDEFKRYSQQKGIDQVFSYPYHPQGNPVETFMKPLGKALKAAFYNRDCAQEAVDNLLKAYRSTPHPTTGISPGDMLFHYGYQSDFPPKTRTDMEVAAGTERDKEQKRQRTEETNRSTKRRTSDIQCGDMVLLKNMIKGRKFDPLYMGEVAEVVEVEQRGVVLKEANGTLKRRHKDDVKPYHPPRPLTAECDDERQEIVPAQGAAGGEIAGALTENDMMAEEGHGRAPVAGTVTPTRRSTRKRDLPGHLKDYVVYGTSKGGRGGK